MGETRGGGGRRSAARSPAVGQGAGELVDVTPAAAAEVDGGRRATLFMRNHFPTRPRATLYPTHPLPEPALVSGHGYSHMEGVPRQSWDATRRLKSAA